ncbi:uncharacterized protein BP01DRAFT_397108 [Aspergillus saccharolyticus JOP 1030-1]|uniref:Uncharacterized protein n=1 Tax=Aspergillus saccharolyticus JOP 1030-1 TaxID=1450539 RepID=A0A318ZGA6_9EURO|nr:hypothetical protein BP01DRAFT_397108 [Aspergillus saccharolyticus JOP 1030-1]PYH46581.1 hypothetical protein BP01DRAFT_397108 [Aspergillus saccharolyticus JOP 1030-1]
MKIICQTCHEFVEDLFSDIAERSGKHSSGTGLHVIDFIGELRYWHDFQDEVEQVLAKVEWENYQHPVTAYIETGDVYYREHFLCGAEISSSARFISNVLNPLTGVANILGYPLYFGDWTVTVDKLKWPVLTLANEQDKIFTGKPGTITETEGKARAIGEAKHPWGTLPDANIKQALKGDKEGEKLLRRFLGQIARDMWAANLKYAFMTNYRWTVFLRREFSDGKWTLYHSDAIKHDSKAQHRDHTASISVRQCVLFTMIKVASSNPEDWSTNESRRGPLSTWVYIAPDKKEGTEKTTSSNLYLSRVQGERGLFSEGSIALANNDLPGKGFAAGKAPELTLPHRSFSTTQINSSNQEKEPTGATQESLKGKGKTAESTDKQGAKGKGKTAGSTDKEGAKGKMRAIESTDKGSSKTTRSTGSLQK